MSKARETPLRPANDTLYKRLNAGAQCVGLPPGFMDPQTRSEAWMALSVCRTCTVAGECQEWVDPAGSYYDGVAAGVWWVNGEPKEGIYPLAVPEILEGHGTRAGYDQHRRLGEKACQPCLDAMRKRQALRRAAEHVVYGQLEIAFA